MKRKSFNSKTEAINYLETKYPDSFIDTGVERGHIDIALAFDMTNDENPKELERVYFN